MARSRDNRPGHDRKALPEKPETSPEDDVKIPEVVDVAPKLVTSQVVQVLVQENKQNDLKGLLDTELEYNKKRFEIIRKHKELDPDAIEHRKTKASRRHIYWALVVIATGLLVSMPFINLVAAGIFGTIGMIIICGVMLNARDRELDLAGMLQMIQAIANRRLK